MSARPSGEFIVDIYRRLDVSHSTVSRYKNKYYKKRHIDIYSKYSFFIDYLQTNYDWRIKSISVCIQRFKKYHPNKPYVSHQTVYRWINEGKLDIKPNNMCYKRRKRKKSSGMMQHMLWNLDNKTAFVNK